MVDIIGFDDAMKAAGENPSLMIANGFSIKYFRYANLLEKAGLDEGSPLRALFGALSTFDFEVVIRALEDAALVERAYSKEKRAELLASEADKLRGALVHAVRVTHPKHREDIADQIPACVKFLSQYDTIFTLNYDLLLYWVILENTKQFKDGFGLAEDRNGFRWPFKTDAHCNIYNLHGGLHLFKTEDDELEKRIDQGSGVIDAIASTITQAKRLPLYVAEGTSAQKLARIYATPYLRHCYEMLKCSESAFFVYGHSASPNDAHIYDALFSSDISHLYFCVHKPTANVEEIDGELSRHQKRNGSQIGYTLVDSETANVWG
ncbi:DUF4917 family protein [Bradyrhizobium tropiciagri]|uniref:DUF4917 family protein n=1 Tax=Bradyrhizobium tropiciagri TaxID=312253 RepID=UPI001BAC545C|nr:DUF4917 family protein [Bradyrhizobium tropiciagri]MBR0873046.1 DUF4917 family protein [Bradyrhizobium tropiciagri]